MMFWKTQPYTDWFRTIEALWASQKYEQAHRMIAKRNLSDQEIVHLFYLSVVFSSSDSPAKYPNLRPALPWSVVKQLYAKFESVLDPNIQVPSVPGRDIRSEQKTVSLLNGVLPFTPLSMISKFLKRSTPETLMKCNTLMHIPPDKMTVELLEDFEHAGLNLEAFKLQFHPLIQTFAPFRQSYDQLKDKQAYEEQRERIMEQVGIGERSERKPVM